MSASDTTTSSPLPGEPKTWGLMAEYSDVGRLLTAAEQIRDAGYQRWDCYTPFPVHGLDRAMGLKTTVLPWIVLMAGLTGCTTALLLQFYVNTPHLATAVTGVLSSYPLVFSGKPYWSLPANIPVIFELTVLFSALATFFGLWGLNRLPRYHHPAFGNVRFKRVTDDTFFIIIEVSDRNFDLARTRELLAGSGSVAVEEVKD